MPCYLLDILDASGQPVVVAQVHPRDAVQPHRPEELAVLMARVADSDWLRGLTKCWPAAPVASWPCRRGLT